MTSDPLHVAVIDIGNSKNIGWAIEGPQREQGNNIAQCVAALARVLDQGPLALGFEAPTFVPLHQDAGHLTRGRHGEADRAFTAGPGATVMASGLVVVPYVLAKLRMGAPAATVTLGWTAPPMMRGQLLVFEAFVTHQSATDEDPHIRDAKAAIKKFQEGMQRPAELKSAVIEPNCFNLLGAALLRVGWTMDQSVLSQACLVVRHKGS